MDQMESFFKDKIDAIHKSLEAKESAFEKLHQEERENAKQSNAASGSQEERKLRWKISLFFFFFSFDPYNVIVGLHLKYLWIR